MYAAPVILTVHGSNIMWTTLAPAVRLDMCADVCVAMYIDVCVDVCVDMYRRVWTTMACGGCRHLRRHVCRRVCRHVCRHVRSVSSRHAFLHVDDTRYQYLAHFDDGGEGRW